MPVRGDGAGGVDEPVYSLGTVGLGRDLDEVFGDDVSVVISIFPAGDGEVFVAANEQFGVGFVHDVHFCGLVL